MFTFIISRFATFFHDTSTHFSHTLGRSQNAIPERYNPYDDNRDVARGRPKRGLV